MSITSHRHAIDRLRNDIVRLNSRANQETAKVAGYERDIARLMQSIRPTTADSIRRSKLQQIESRQRSLLQAKKQESSYQTQSARKHEELNRRLTQLQRAEEQQQRRQDQEDRQRRQEEARHSRQLTRDLQTRARLNQELSRSRYVIDLAALPRKINVLFLASNPLSEQPLRLDEEIREITRQIRAAEYRDSIDLRQAWAVRSEDIIQALNEHKPRVVHFSGHGTQGGQLVLQDDSGNAKLVSSAAIAATLATLADNIQLVVFNSCFSETQARAITEHIAFAIGMDSAIGDDAARVFAGQLYSSIAFGQPLSTAFEQARAKLMLEGIPQEHVPQLYWKEGLNPGNTSLVQPASEPRQQPIVHGNP